MPSAICCFSSFCVSQLKSSTSGSCTAPSGLVALYKSAGGEPFAVGADGDRADAAEVDLLAAFVGVQRLGVERADFLAAWRRPIA